MDGFDDLNMPTATPGHFRRGCAANRLQLLDGGRMRAVGKVILAFFWIVPISLAQTEWQTLGKVSSFEKRADGIDVLAQHGRVRVSVLSPAVVRVLYSPKDQFIERQSF